LDNDRVTRDLRAHLVRMLGPDRVERYWAIFEDLRHELGYADYLGALQRYRIEQPRDPQFQEISHFLIAYPFANRLYPGSIDALERMGTMGQTVILSDGDVVFQPRKIERSGIHEAVSGRVLIYIHKEQMLDEVEKRYPARHYVLVDDKVRILSAVKTVWGNRLTTVFPRQGHYALDAALVAAHPPPDVSIEHIGDLVHYDLLTLLAAGQNRPIQPSPPAQSSQDRGSS
jgi:FMN phosphatase YigB (HAD superfamily)